MNKDLEKIIIKHQIHPVAYQKKGKVYLIYSHDKCYVIKLNTNNYDIYKYLVSRDFLSFPNNYNDINDDYDILEYIDDLNINKEQKINDYLNLLALLHKKTSYKREIDLDEIKGKYESLTNKIITLKNYYQGLNDYIDKETFLSPAMYLLVRNISLIYQVLDNALVLLNELYSKIKDDKSIRVALLHNNVSLDHLITNDKNYLISWDKAYFTIPVYEISEFYRKYYHDMEINDFIKAYQNINKLSDNEKKLLLILLLIPKELHLTNDTYLDTKIINDEINYLNKVYELLMSTMEKSPKT